MPNHSKSRPAASDLRTAQEAREWLVANGITVVQFAKTHALPVYTVKDVLLGRSKARTGMAHAAAVALGMKPNPRLPAKSRENTRGR